MHDLTHYAVETALGYRRGFFGLIAEGWDVEGTTGKGARGPLPVEAGEVERIVGLFDSERGSGAIWTVEEFNQFAPRALSDEEIRKVRAFARSVIRTVARDGAWRKTGTGTRLKRGFIAGRSLRQID